LASENLSPSLSPIRELNPEELSSLNELVSTAFGYVSPDTFFDDFPIWKSTQVKRFGIFSGDALVAHVGIRFCEMKVPGRKNMPIAMIGAVATLESYRGQGLSSKLLEAAVKASEDHNCDWTLLWGSEHDFYKKFGFELRGEQFQAPLADLEDLPENKIPHVKRGWNSRIFDYLSDALYGIKLTENDRDWVSDHKTVQWIYCEEPFAFVGFERGLDLHHIVHEFGGDEDAMKEIFSYVLSLDQNAHLLGTFEDLECIGFDETAFIEEYLCLARPHSGKKDLEWSSEYWVSGLSAC